MRVVYLAQDPEFDSDHTLFDAMLSVFGETIAAKERLDVLAANVQDVGILEDLRIAIGRA